MLRACKTWSTPVVEEKRAAVPCDLCGSASFASSLACEGFSYVRCRRCSLTQVNPQPASESVARRYGDDYLAYEIANEESFLRLQLLGLSDAGFWRLERDLMARGRPPRVLDVGCATGALLERLRDRGWIVVGAEISPSARHARETRGLDVRGAALEDCAFPGGGFDAALASHLIEHLNRPRAFVREIMHVLAPGGHFLVTTPNIDGFQARLFGPKWRAAIFDHLYLFSKRTLRALLESEGFEVLGIRTWGGLAAGTAPSSLKTLADKAAKTLGIGDVMLVKARKPG